MLLPYPIIRPTAQELADRTLELGCELQSRLYLSEEKKRIIIVPLWFPGQEGIGITFEQKDPPTVIPFSSSKEEIGRLAAQSLMLFDSITMEIINQFRWNLRDWPAFQASGMKTAKAFRYEYTPIHLSTINTVIRVEGHPSPDDKIFVGAFAGKVDKEELGDTVLQVYRACEKLW